jgi:drug/metabolite transporter (DMT)-like permease
LSGFSPSGGLVYGGLSGITFALYSIAAAYVMGREPLAGAVGYFTAPLAAAALNDSLSAGWLFLYNRYMGPEGRNRRGPGIRDALKGTPGRVIVLGAVIGGPLANSAYLAALKNAGPAYALPVSALSPLFGGLFAFLFLKQRISRQTALGMIIGVLGVVLLTQNSSQNTGGLSSALALAFLAAAGWGADAVCAAYAMKVVPPETAIQIRQCVSGLVLLVVAGPVLRGWSLLGETIRSPLPAACLLAASFFTAVSFLCWYKANHSLGVAAGMSLNITYILWGALFSALLLGQAPGLWQILGTLTVFVGVVLLAFGQRGSKKAENL